MLSNTQAAIAETVKALVAESDAAALTSIDKALEAGAMLVEAKDAAAHGTWLPFLERAGVQERKAQRPMTLARSGLKSDAVSDLGGITAALKFLAERRLPTVGTCVVVAPDELLGYEGPVSLIWPCSEHVGYFFVARISPEENVEYTFRPVAARIDFDDGRLPVFPVWESVAHQLGVRYYSMKHWTVPAEFDVLDEIEGWAAEDRQAHLLGLRERLAA